MIKNVTIENYKSIHHLEVELGRVNVIIGENGSGKTNILEALAIAGAASQNKLDHEFLYNRGIRATNPRMMMGAFGEFQSTDKIKVMLGDNEGGSFGYLLFLEDREYPEWWIVPLGDKAYTEKIKEKLEKANVSLDELEKIGNLFNKIIDVKNARVEAILEDLAGEITPLPNFKNFLIYRPEESTLREETNSPLQPLGIRGEGLFKLLEVFKKEEQQQEEEEDYKPLSRLVELLNVIDWFEDLDIEKSEFGQRALKIKDRYLSEMTEYISQHSANEGFLFLLFYFSLFISKHTPKFFAIDNIDNSLNPKLCRTLTKILAQLAEEYDKQVILTTHNPAILDGLDLKDDDQRLFVVSRNKLGHTKINRFEKKANLNGTSSVKLSEAFMRGYIGGLPKGF